MALIKCVECGNDVSDKAITCPKCGMPLQTEELKDNNETEKICVECGNTIDLATGICTNCGYNPEKVNKHKKAKKKKVAIIVSSIVVVGLLLLAIVMAINANKGNAYVMSACEELANEEGGLPGIEKIYISEKIDDGSSTIDYVYRIYIEYESRWGTEKVMYIVDDKDERYFITEYSSEKLTCYIGIAEVEIHGIEGWFEPSDNWKELSSSDVKKIENKFD